MLTQNDYTKRELELRFERIEEILEDIRATLKENNTRIDSEIKEIRKEVQSIKDWQNRLMAIWGVIVFILGLVGQQVLRIFTS